MVERKKWLKVSGGETEKSDANDLQKEFKSIHGAIGETLPPSLIALATVGTKQPQMESGKFYSNLHYINLNVRYDGQF